MSLRLICLLWPRHCMNMLSPTDDADPKVVRVQNAVEFRFNVQRYWRFALCGIGGVRRS